MSAEAQTNAPASPSLVRRVAGALRPRAWMGRVPGPIFQKEVWVLNKRASTSWIRMAYGIVLISIVSLVFGSFALEARRMQTSVGWNWSGYAGSGASAALQTYQSVAPAVTVAIAWTQFVLLALVGCALGAPAICDEKRAGTLGTLLATPVTAWQIVLGKLLGRCVEMAILMLLSLPLLLAVRTFGGVPAEHVVAFSLLSGVTALLAVQLGIFMSIRSKRSGAAFLSALVLLFLLLAALPFFAFVSVLVMQVTGGTRLAGPPVWLFWSGVTCSPAVMTLLTIDLLSGDAMASTWATRIWPACVGALLGMWALFFALSSASLRRAMSIEQSGRSATLSASAATVSRRWFSRTSRLVEAAPSPSAGGAAGGQEDTDRRGKRRASLVREGVSRSVTDPSIFWRERQFKLFASSPMKRTLGVLVLALLWLLLVWAAEMDKVAQIIAIMLVFVLTVIVATNFTAASIAGEREGRTLEVLLTTPASSWQIIWQKYLGGLGRMRIMPAIILLLCMVFVFAGPFSRAIRMLDVLTPRTWYRSGNWVGDALHIAAVPVAALVIIGPLVALTASGIFFSTWTRSSTRAGVLNLVFAIGLWVGPPLGGVLLHELFRLPDEVGEFFASFNPFVQLGVLLAEASTNPFPGGFGLWSGERFDMPIGNLTFVQMIALVIVNTALYAGVAWCFLKAAAGLLRSTHDRR